MAKNIRIDTLPRDRLTEIRDCQLCTRRRIKCDRTLPACYKCQSRNLQCPGYRQRWKWLDGLANCEKRRPDARVGTGNVTLEDATDECKNADDRRLAVCQNESRDRDWASTTALLARQPSSIAREMGLSSHAMLATLNSRLVTHFLVHVTPRLRWIDHENPWRGLLLPHSRTSVTLQLAILTLSAAHLSVTSDTNAEHAQSFRRICDTLSRETLKSLTAQVRQLTGNREMNNGGSHLYTTEMLATMFVLCHVEMLLPESQVWDIHLRAFRVTWNRERLYGHQSLLEDPFTLFLKKAMADIEVFEIPSSFSRSPESPQIPLAQLTFSDRAWTFTTFSREVTALENRLHNRRLRGLPDPVTDMSSWRCKLDVAYLMALSSTSSLWAGYADTQTAFNKVVTAHYYAGLVYSYQALARGNDKDSVIRGAVDRLILEIQYITEGPIRQFDQNIFWPLFIAGTECSADRDRQSRLQLQFRELIAATGFWCNEKALHFLQVFWSDAERSPSDNWIQYSRINGSKFSGFLVY